METLSINHQVAAIRDLIGWLPRLREFESVTRAEVTEDKITVIVERVRFTETAGRYKITARGQELIVWKRDPDIRCWLQPKRVIGWEECDEVALKFDIPTPQQVAAQKRWERDCYRPGTARNPMDREGI